MGVGAHLGAMCSTFAGCELDGVGERRAREGKSVTPRQRGVWFDARSCEYMLHIGRVTTAMPAFATAATTSRCLASGCTESEQQCPH